MTGHADPHEPGRPIIALSWERAARSGLDPGQSRENPLVEEFNRRSRLVVAAEPVLEAAATELEGTRFSLMLADAQARIVDIRCGDKALQPGLERIGATFGTRFTESTTGTNAIATTLEERRGLAVSGDEHFIDSFKIFSCYGHPIIHPITRRVEGILDITCLNEDRTPLITPFVVRAVGQIEKRLLHGAREADRRLMSEFHDLRTQNRTRPVVALGDDMFLANRAATELLDDADQAILRRLAVEAPSGRSFKRSVELVSGVAVTIEVRGVGGDGRALMTIEQATSRVLTSPTRRISPTQRVAILGEPGSGHTTSVKRLASGSPLAIFDAGEVAFVGEHEWQRTVSEALESESVVAIEAVHLLPAAVARWLVNALQRSTSRILLTSAPLSQLRGEVAGLIAQCVERIELTPLRQRRHEIPGLTRSILDDLGLDSTVRFTPGSLEALASQEWPGNLRELATVVAYVSTKRTAGDITVADLPEAYRSRARARLLTPIEQAQYDAVQEALREANWEKKAAANRLGISRTTLYKLIRTLGVPENR